MSKTEFKVENGKISVRTGEVKTKWVFLKAPDRGYREENGYYTLTALLDADDHENQKLVKAINAMRKSLKNIDKAKAPLVPVDGFYEIKVRLHEFVKDKKTGTKVPQTPKIVDKDKNKWDFTEHGGIFAGATVRVIFDCYKTEYKQKEHVVFVMRAVQVIDPSQPKPKGSFNSFDDEEEEVEEEEAYDF